MSPFVISSPANMAVKTEKDLSQGLRALWLKAVAAIEMRNLGYAIFASAGTPEAGARVPDWPSTIATRRSDEKQIGEEKFF